ncbi:MAG: response regulator [Cardiobacteriaceae bacterium]|nr:response regulator [Cardiobacteriaceae bacterium]
MSAQEKPNIIFIDDDPRILRSLNSIFRASHNVYTTEDPDDFREKVATIPMDVIVCDQKMPLVSGTELLAEVRQSAPDAMRILLTGYADRDDVLDAINEGEIYRYITKPWDTDDLLRTIADATNIARALRHMRELQEDDDENASAANVQTGIMVMFENEKIFEKFRYVFGRHYTPYWAKDLDSAMEILLHHHIGIIVSDVHFCGQDIVSAMNVLKSFFPQIMSIVVTQTQDSEALIDLINYGQVHRCLVRPVSTKLLSDNLRGAAIRHAFLRDNPEAQARHKVETLESEDDSGKVKELLDTIRKRQDERLESGSISIDLAENLSDTPLDFDTIDDTLQIFEAEAEDAEALAETVAETVEDAVETADETPEKPVAYDDSRAIEFTLGDIKAATTAAPSQEETNHDPIDFDESDLAILDDDSVEIIDAGYEESKTAP